MFLSSCVCFYYRSGPKAGGTNPAPPYAQGPTNTSPASLPRCGTALPRSEPGSGLPLPGLSSKSSLVAAAKRAKSLSRNEARRSPYFYGTKGTLAQSLSTSNIFRNTELLASLLNRRTMLIMAGSQGRQHRELTGS